MRLIREDYADAMIAGGTEPSSFRSAVGGFCAMKALSTRNDEPERASPSVRRRPRRLRDGRRRGHPRARGTRARDRARGATIYAEIAGYGMSGDAYHISAPAPDGEGAPRAMRGALADARLEPTRGRLHQRARHIDAGRRHDRDARGQARSSATHAREARGRLDEVDDRPSARRGGRVGDRDHRARGRARRRRAAHDQLRDARSGVRPRLRSQYRANACRSGPRSTTPSASAARTRRCS